MLLGHQGYPFCLELEASYRLDAGSGADPAELETLARALRHEGDQSSHEFLIAELARRRPSDSVLSEEGADDRTRLLASSRSLIRRASWGARWAR